LLWLLKKTKTINALDNVKIACIWAEHVLYIFEEKYPNDKLLHLVIEAIKKWINDPTEENKLLIKSALNEALKINKNAAVVAVIYAVNTVIYAAAYAAAADAHADAYAAAAAADAYAADAAADVYTADAAAVYSVTYDTYVAGAATERKWQADTIRQLIPCPFTADTENQSLFSVFFKKILTSF
jgi:pyrimidine deaminase RibD-like protein